MNAEALAALTGAGGIFVGAAAAWRRGGSESESIAVTTLKAVIQELRAELDRKEVEINVMRVKLDKLDRNLNVLADLPPGYLA